MVEAKLIGMKYRTGIGQDSHRFLTEEGMKPCVIGGLIFRDVPGLRANSDGDVVFHAICNAISSVTGVVILGDVADKLLKTRGITDSRYYLDEAVKSLGKMRIIHVALSLEGARPYFLERNLEMRQSIAKALEIDVESVGLTATTGERLTDFGRGEGIQCFCIVTVMEP